MRPIGVIKIGTSHTAMLAALELSAPLIRRGRLIDLRDPSTWNTLTQTMTEYTRLMEDLGVHFGVVSGGEALRENGLLRQHIQDLGLPFWPVSPILEGRLTWLAVRSEIPDISTIIDVGGGSTEVVTEQAVYSLAVGATRVPQEMQWPPLGGRGGTTALVGGTASALEMLAGEPVISRERLLSLLNSILLDDGEPIVLKNLNAARQRLVVGGSRVIRALLEVLDSPRFVMAHRGFLEGLWLAASLGKARRL